MPDFSTYNDLELLRLLAKSEESALREIMRRYSDSLFARAYNFLGSVESAKDCVQEVFLSLWKNRETAVIENLHHYLHQAARFQAFQALRASKASVDLEKRLADLTLAVVQDDNLAYKELKKLLQDCLAELPEDMRNIFLLHREEALSYREIAEKLNISVKTVEKKMSGSLRYLRERIVSAIFLFLYFLLFFIG